MSKPYNIAPYRVHKHVLRRLHNSVILPVQSCSACSKTSKNTCSLDIAVLFQITVLNLQWFFGLVDNMLAGKIGKHAVIKLIEWTGNMLPEV